MGKRTERGLNWPTLGVQTRENGGALIACNADAVVAGFEVDPIEDLALLGSFDGVGSCSALRFVILVAFIIVARESLEATKSAMT